MLALALLLACTGPVLDDGEVAGEVIEDVRVAPQVVPTVVRVEWTTSSPCDGRVELGLDGEYARWFPADSDDGLEHGALVMGLKAGRDYALRPVVTCDDGVHEGEEVWISTPDTPWDLPRLEVRHAAPPERLQSGYFLTAELQMGGSWIAILDRDWDTVWWWDAGEVNVFTAGVAPDGSGIYYAQNSQNQDVDIGATVHVPWTGRDARTTCNFMGHHTSVELPDGSVGFLSVDLRTVDVDGEPTLVAGDAVLEAPRHASDCADHVEVFSFFNAWSPEEDHAVEFHDCEVAGGADWTHANSLMYGEADDAWYVGVRNLDALVKLDRATGEILWQMGGPDSDFEFGNPYERWNHGHMSHLWDDGFMVFDNGTSRDPQHTRVSRYSYDEEARTVRLEWDHWQAEGLHVPFAGDASRLPNGDVLVSWGSLGRLTEHHGDEVVMEGEMPLGAVLGRVEWVESLGDLPLGGLD